MLECEKCVPYEIVEEGDVQIQLIHCLRSGPGFRLLQMQTDCKWPEFLSAHWENIQGTEKQPTLVRVLVDSGDTFVTQYPQVYTTFYIPSLLEGPGQWELFMARKEKYTYHLVYTCDPEKDSDWQGKEERS